MDRRNPPGALLALLFLFWSASAGSAEPVVEVLTYLRPYRSIEMAATETGVVSQLLVQEGQEVQEGDPLIKLDTDVIEARLAIAKEQAANDGRVTAAASEHSLNQSRYEIVAGLKEKGTANSAEVDRLKATLQTSTGSLVTARSEHRIAQLQVAQIEAELARRLLRSPIRGVVVDITKDIAEPVTPRAGEEDYLIRVVELDRLQARAYVPFLAASRLKKGDRLRAILQDGTKTVGEGVIDYISPIVDPATGTVTIRLVFDNRQRLLTSGVPARLQVPAP